ncbi:tetratricopeptide repeat protein [Candidatus Fermentibacteria bacterium]|nr:tetratricopeptide repeat protein [Candidatus Fermentibacteria bacterium]
MREPVSGEGSKGTLPVGDLVMVASVALLTRTIHLFSILEIPLLANPVVDARWHHLWASAVAGGDLAAYAPFFRAPLYPWVLGSLYFLTGPSVLAGTLLSVGLDVTSAILVYLIASRFVGRGWALGASLCWGLWGTAVFYSTTLLITPLFTFLLLWSMWLALRGKAGSWLLLGLACVTRPTALLLLPLLWWYHRPDLKRGCMFAAPLVLVWAFNAGSGDPLNVVASQGGINLYVGNGPDADGYTAFAPAYVEAGEGGPEEPEAYRDNVQAAAEQIYRQRTGSEGGVEPSAVSGWWTARTLEHVLRHPLAWLSLEGKKLLCLASTVEIPSNYDPYYYRRYSPLLAVLLRRRVLALPFAVLWLLVPGALWAGIGRRRKSRAMRMLDLWTCLLLLAPLLFFVTARLRLPAVPFLLIALLVRVSRAPRVSLLLAPAGFVAGFLLLSATEGYVERSGVNMEFFDGVAHVREGRIDRAEALFLRAVQRGSSREDRIDLNRMDALYNLGLIAAGRGDMEEAEQWAEVLRTEYPGSAKGLRLSRILQGVDPGLRQQ